MTYTASTPLHMALWDGGGEVEVEAVIGFDVIPGSPATSVSPAEEPMVEVTSFRLRKPKTMEWLTTPAWIDQSAQPREALNNDRIAEYSEAMKAGEQFPPLTVFHDGETYWLADGFHRHYAAQHAGRRSIRCYVREGGLRDAILFSVGANAKHGLARSDEDKKRAIMRLLDDAEWSQWSDREIARRCRVSDKTVAKYRPAASADDPQIERKVQRGGTVYTWMTGRPPP